MATTDQYEIDSVGHYVEAALELRLSAFLDQDSHRATLTQCGDDVRAELADERILAQFILPFRRIWMKREATQFGRIRNILFKRAPEGVIRNWLSYLHDRLQKECEEWFPQPTTPYGLTPAEVIDLMLNTRYAHVGADANRRFTRADLERHERAIGAERLEWLFQSHLQNVGHIFMMLGDIALSALDHWARTGFGRPSFALSCVVPVTGLEIEVKPPPKITRSTPGWTPAPESSGGRVWRLLRRRRYQNLAKLLEFLGLQDTAPVVLANAECFQDLTNVSPVRLEFWNELGETRDLQSNVQRATSCLDMECGQKGSLVVTREGTLRIYGDVPLIIDRELAAIKKVLTEGEPIRLWMNHPRRFRWATQ